MCAQPLRPYDWKQAGDKRRKNNRQIRSRGAASGPVTAGPFAPERRYLAARGPAIAAMAAASYQGMKFMRSVINAEKNFFDYSGNPPPAVIATATLLSGVPIGDDVGQRSGRSIKLKGWSLAVLLNAGPTATGNSYVRVLVVKDMFAQGVAPTLAQVLQQTGTIGVISPLLESAQQTRFKVLVDDLVVICCPNASSSCGGTTEARTYSSDLQNHIEYIGTSGTVSDAGTGAMYLFLIADQITSNIVNSAVYSRLRYYDN